MLLAESRLLMHLSSVAPITTSTTPGRDTTGSGSGGREDV
jgi:hypothetical protein